MSKPQKKKPGAIIVAGERWPVHLLRVVDRDPDGAPRTLVVCRDDEAIKVDGTTGLVNDGENVFFTVYGHPGLSTRNN
jgi:hypothetical protein